MGRVTGVGGGDRRTRPEPATGGVYVTEQIGVSPGSEHWVALKLPPGSLEEKATVPVGMILWPAELSTTFAEHVVCVPPLTGLGEQLTPVMVERLVTDTLSRPLPPEYSESPW